MTADLKDARTPARFPLPQDQQDRLAALAAGGTRFGTVSLRVSDLWTLDGAAGHRPEWTRDAEAVLGRALRPDEILDLPLLLRTLPHTPARWLAKPDFQAALNAALQDVHTLLGTSPDPEATPAARCAALCVQVRRALSSGVWTHGMWPGSAEQPTPDLHDVARAWTLELLAHAADLRQTAPYVFRVELGHGRRTIHRHTPDPDLAISEVLPGVQMVEYEPGKPAGQRTAFRATRHGQVIHGHLTRS